MAATVTRCALCGARSREPICGRHRGLDRLYSAVYLGQRSDWAPYDPLGGRPGRQPEHNRMQTTPALRTPAGWSWQRQLAELLNDLDVTMEASSSAED